MRGRGQLVAMELEMGWRPKGLGTRASLLQAWEP